MNAPVKPSKPTSDFPLFPHASRQWAKKVGGKLHYFGPWADPQAALDRFNAWRNGNGHKPRILADAQQPGKSRNGKPKKPYPDFPLYAHAAGQWAKRIQGHVHYFGPWADPQAALDKYLAQKDALLAGRDPPVDGLTVKELANRFLNSKRLKVQSGDLKERTFADYKIIVDSVVDLLTAGRAVATLDHSDFERLRSKFAEGRGPVSLGNYVGATRILFKYAFDTRLIDQPMRFGPEFRKPSRTVLRHARQAKGPRFFTRRQLRAMLRAAPEPLRTMILLGINCAFGNHDCATLPISAIDLARGWVNFPRPKTAVPRRCRLWPQTVDALRQTLACRQRPKDRAHADTCFLTRFGEPWTPKGRNIHYSPISRETAKLLKDLGIYRKGLSFYALRHTFQTIGEESGDAVAVKSIMGHIPEANDMSAVYRERMTDKRLHAVAAYVRRWLFKKQKGRSRSSRPAASASAASAVPAEPSSAAS
jgi:integrase